MFDGSQITSPSPSFVWLTGRQEKAVNPVTFLHALASLSLYMSETSNDYQNWLIPILDKVEILYLVSERSSD